MTPLSGSSNGKHKGGDKVVVTGCEVLGILVVGAMELLSVVVVSPEVDSDAEGTPTMPVDSRTATV